MTSEDAMKREQLQALAFGMILLLMSVIAH
jgi:hypothetical protein